MTALIAAPLLLPALMAAATLIFMRRHRWIGAAISIAGATGLLALAVYLLSVASRGTISVYALGDWAAPFGIVLVLDRLSAMMLLITALLALPVLCHAVLTGLDRKGWHFHPLFQFQLLGINGAFLTGDLFNLFVFFEVLLIASYGLMLHGQGAERLKAGVQYVIVNLIGSTLFLFAIGLLYGITGTLNMADMTARIPALPAADQGLLRAGAHLLTLVFALKAALLPLQLWLPRTYAGTSAPVAALFAIMTKVGAYAIIRTSSLIFGDQAGAAAWAPEVWMMPAALATMAIGFAGLLAARSLRDLAAFGLLGSTATLLVAIAAFDRTVLTAGLYYLAHTTLAAALLFLVVDLIRLRRGRYGDTIVPSPRFAGIEPLSALYLLAAMALAGLPPLSGFIGKLLILQATLADPWAAWIWAVILGTTLLAILGLARAGSAIFWKSAAHPDNPHKDAATAKPDARLVEMLPACALLATLVVLTVAAGPVTRYMDATAQQLFAPTHTIEAVLGPAAGR
ncbi:MULTISPECIES: monovalent cation/H+ antiporter subunit D [unclassified Sphingobium]|uniref:monovalent cation/H+ antiporter subunit D n=1 Tax=unclassified Sphingobium TaxID=2611147 RepID=UPI0022257EF3|nr:MULTISPECIES: monovalent cation/H+ antiporter subunit D [unclassified Sphingobium]MCW2412516.1 multicomponent K+:H+ antiporter subunit D [Sphingobium sp. B8D3D]MCW2415187.1 multicomponent K+:H+ antiporter subunit D [Sphingobium sp. B8D3A]